MKRHARWIMALAFVPLMSVGPAIAASYKVSACDAALGVNNAWAEVVTMAAGHARNFAVCPSEPVDPDGFVAQGIGVEDVLQGADVPSDGAFREWRIRSPEETRIVGFTVTREIGNRDSPGSAAFTPYARTEAADLVGETCFSANDQPYCRISGTTTQTTSATELAWGVRCVEGTFCNQGSTLHHVWNTLLSAMVTIEDTKAPSVAATLIPLADAGLYEARSRLMSIEASDTTGIRELQVRFGDFLVGRAVAPAAGQGGCGEPGVGVAYTFTTPCAGERGLNSPRVIEVNYAALPNGTHTVVPAALDTAGNVGQIAPITVYVDHEPPPAPTLNADDRWSRSAEATITWVIPAETDRAAIRTADVEVCNGSNCTTERLNPDPFGPSPGAAGSTVTYSRAWPVGTRTVRAKHTDSAGNVSAWSEAVSIRRDRTAPTVTLRAPRAVRRGRRIVPRARGVDTGGSGLSRVEVDYRIDRGKWRRLRGSGIRARGRRIRFRAQAVDGAGGRSATASASVRVSTRR